jgi:hypothetical protein
VPLKTWIPRIREKALAKLVEGWVVLEILQPKYWNDVFSRFFAMDEEQLLQLVLREFDLLTDKLLKS